MEYLKIWVSFREVTECLADDEKGRLFDAMLAYAETGEEPELKGNERFVWPCARQNIRKAAEECGRLRANGRKGGRPRREAGVGKPEQENGGEEGVGTLDVPPVRQLSPHSPDRLLDKVQRELTGLTDTHRASLEEYRSRLGDELVEYAVDAAVAHGARSWAYVERVLQSYVKENIRSVSQAKAADEKRRTRGTAHYTLERDDDVYDRMETELSRELFGEKTG